jgi:glutamyl/glutaminyl-tRNA synthetase
MRTRFAPAPTGYLHLGHVFNAAQVWGAAERLDAKVLLRLEDHDGERSRRVFEAAILDDLDWLGFRPDIFPTADFRAGRCDGRQSDREPHYQGAADRLRRLDVVYGCSCSRSDLLTAPRSAAGEPIYTGRCRERGLALTDAVGWRVRIDPGLEHFDDLLRGPQVQDPARQCGDVLIRDRRGNWTYQFAVAVDDWLQEIDLIVRGNDLLESTGRQLRLARLLGRTRPPLFLHHALIMKSPTSKLSKSDGDTAIRSLRAQGWTADRVLEAARAAAAAGPAPATQGIVPSSDAT